MNDPRLYILMRTDLESMNPGKMAAQACHAANQFVFRINEYATLCKEAFPNALSGRVADFEEWQASTPDGFGTTIILDGGSISDIIEFINEIAPELTVASGIVVDPTYPVRDGSVTHLLPLETCAYVFTRDKTLLEKFQLHA